MHSTAENTFHIALLGDGRVGKTKLRQRAMHNVYRAYYQETSFLDFSLYRYFLEEEEITPFYFPIWDLAGFGAINKLRSLYLKRKHVIMLCFDVTRKRTFDALPEWLVLGRNSAPEAKLILVATKIDCVKERVISTEDAKTFAEQNNITSYFETSAQDNIQVHELFKQTAEMLAGKSKSI